MAAAPSPEPTIHRGINMKLAPRKVAVAPVAVATEFIVTIRLGGTTCGSAAESPEVTKRLKPLTISAPHSTNRSRAPAASSAATPRTSTTRAAFATMSTVRRSQRSSSAPANGPSNE